MDSHKQIWEKWNKGGGPKYPHEKVIQFVFRNYPKEIRKSTKVLDLGCGTGVNTIFLAQEDFKVSFCDISEVGVNNTIKMLKAKNLPFDESRICSIDKINFETNSFDLIICVGIMDSAGKEITVKTIPLLYQILKKDGKAMFLFASNKDMRIVNKNSYNLYGYSEEEVKKLFSKFEWKELNIDRYITTFNSGQNEFNDFLITLQK